MVTRMYLCSAEAFSASVPSAMMKYLWNLSVFSRSLLWVFSRYSVLHCQITPQWECPDVCPTSFRGHGGLMWNFPALNQTAVKCDDPNFLDVSHNEALLPSNP